MVIGGKIACEIVKIHERVLLSHRCLVLESGCFKVIDQVLHPKSHTLHYILNMYTIVHHIFVLINSSVYLFGRNELSFSTSLPESLLAVKDA